MDNSSSTINCGTCSQQYCIVMAGISCWAEVFLTHKGCLARTADSLINQNKIMKEQKESMLLAKCSCNLRLYVCMFGVVAVA